MKPLARKVGLLTAALILAAILILAVGSSRDVSAGCGSDVSWQIWNELDSRQTTDTQNGRTTDTQDVSNRSVQHSNNGQDSTDTQTNHVNPDGSFHDYDEFNYSDSEGKGCNSDGVSWRGDSRTEDDTDSKGNKKQHHEEIIEKNGKCKKYVRDREWDSKGKLIKDVVTRSEIPCSKYNLQVTFNGILSKPGATVVYGPNTVVVHLEDKGNTYEGKYKSMLDGNVSGFCNGYITWPVTIEVTATKDKEFEDLVFSVKTTMDEPIPLGTCKNLSGNMKAGAIIVPQHDFRLADEGGSSISVTDPESPITWTYTLIQKK